MGREIRRVAPDWVHPPGQCLFDGSSLLPEENTDPECPFEPSECMPLWTNGEDTHFQVYEDTSEGSPISPVFPTVEECARWCVANRASAFGGRTASLEFWMSLRIVGVPR